MLLTKLPPATLRGKVRYSFLDENDQPTYAHDQHGNRIWGGHWNDNLITDAGLDAYGTLVAVPVLDSTAQQWRQWLRVGSGSGEPAPSDAALNAEVQAGASDGGFGGQNTFPDPSGGVIAVHSRITRVITMSDAANLSEYGFSNTETGALHIRELFRDEEDDPITISIAAGKKIRLDHTLIVEAPWGVDEQTLEIEEYDVSGALVTTHALTVDALVVAVDASVTRQLLFDTLQPATLGGVCGLHMDTAPSVTPTATAAPNGASRNTSLDGYAPSALKRRASATFLEPDGNGAVAGFTIGKQVGFSVGTNGTHGFRVAFKTPTTFTKADTHTLTLALEVSWARG